MENTVLQPKLFEDQYCPGCGKDLCAKETIEIQFVSERHETFESFLSELRQSRGILKPEENCPSFLPKKQPIVDKDGITLFTHWDSEYFIDWNRISKSEDLLMFVLHLTEKCWINRENIRFLIEEASYKYKFGHFKEKNA